MSLLGQPFATPSRVRGVYRYMLRKGNKGARREGLERILSPSSLIGDEGSREMIRAVIIESIKLGLLVEEDSRVTINPALPAEAKNKSTGDQLLPKTIADLIFSQDNLENRDLCLAIAWYQTQDVYKAAGNWPELESELQVQIGGNRLGITNDVRYGQFEDWVVYLGFASNYSYLLPNPSCYLRFILRDLFKSVGTKLVIGDLLERVAKTAPVFENGYLRMEIDDMTGKKLLSDQVSTTTAFAWRLLEEDGYVRLAAQSDAKVYMFPDGEAVRRVSEITWLSEEGGSAHGI